MHTTFRLGQSNKTETTILASTKAHATMKYLGILITSLSILFSQNSVAFDLGSEIKSGSFCKTEIFDRFKLIEKTKHKMLKFRPSKELMDFAISMELMCPWSVQRDFNGDKKEDWVGFTKIGEKFELIAYLSKGRNYTIQIIGKFDRLPTNRFLRWMQTRTIKNYTDKKIHLGGSQYALMLANFEKTNDIYLWDGNKLNKILTTPQLF